MTKILLNFLINCKRVSDKVKKLLLLGGSRQQIPAIKTANKLGYYTILCDFLPDNPGQSYSDEFHCISTTDKKSILAIAKEKNIDGIVAYASDPAASTAAYVAEKMGLPTNPYKSVELLTNKDMYRDFLNKNNFSTPKAKGFSTVDEAKRDIKSFKLPVIIKPVDSSGSKGVSKIESYDNLEKQMLEALKFSRAKRVIIEEYVEMEGYQVAGDGFSVDGKLVFHCFANDHFNMNGLNPYVPISASFPYNMPKKIHDKIHLEIQRLFDLLNLKTGAYNFDVRVDKDENVYLMEIGPRNGGNYIPQVIQHATGINMIEYTIKTALGEKIDNLSMIKPQGYWSYYAIHSLKSGRLREIRIKEDVLENNIIEKHMNYSIGDKIPVFNGSNSTLGILIMKFNSMEQMLDMMDNSEKWIEVVVE